MIEPGERILLTGAAGLIGTIVRPALSQHRLRLHDRHATPGELRENEEPWIGDLGDHEELRHAVDGCAAVVHLGANPRVGATWSQLKTPNIDGTYHIFDACQEAGVRRVVFASSNHVTGMLDQRGEWPISAAGSELAPDSLYAVSKVFGEALGRYYAETTDLSVICLRIGWVTDGPRPDNPHWRRLWLSDADVRQLISKSLTAEVRFGIFYGVSGNTPLRYDLDEPRRDLGYVPEDDSSRQ